MIYAEKKFDSLLAGLKTKTLVVQLNQGAKDER